MADPSTPLLAGKVAVVLGASSGIGWATAERFAEHGAKVVVAARRLENLEKLAARVDGVAVQCDGSDFGQLEALAQTTLERFGSIDVAVNSAGLNRPCPIKDITPEVMHEVADIQFFGATYFMRHFANAMAETGGGSLINVTSATAIAVPVSLAPYAGAKAGINFITKVAAREYGPDQVRVNALAPSFVPTAMNGFGGMTPVDEARVEINEEAPIAQAFLDETPIARVITVDECADVALFLASDLSSSMTGQVIPVDGGNHLCRLPNFGPAPRRRN
ncbi:MAG: SDR family oxidoreductase [Myxococcota bacterium]|jgi:3-oxoacyl-[acyl-carrier protein] reductase|nr:SDR family oxidoreductase [Myxococcota bacterium]